MTDFALTTPSPLRRWATFSPCRNYRYLLGREWDPSLPRVLVCGLNPSKASETDDDATARKLVGFGRRWGCGSFEIVNAFAYVATSPADLIAEPTMDGYPRHPSRAPYATQLVPFGVRGGR